MVEGVGVHLDFLFDGGGAGRVGEVAEGFEEALQVQNLFPSQLFVA